MIEYFFLFPLSRPYSTYANIGDYGSGSRYCSRGWYANISDYSHGSRYDGRGRYANIGDYGSCSRYCSRGWYANISDYGSGSRYGGRDCYANIGDYGCGSRQGSLYIKEPGRSARVYLHQCIPVGIGHLLTGLILGPDSVAEECDDGSERYG